MVIDLKQFDQGMNNNDYNASSDWNDMFVLL